MLNEMLMMEHIIGEKEPLTFRKAPEGGHTRALILSGGGAKGAYEIGAWKALREIGYDFSIVTGASVGALNAAMVAAGDVELAEKMWEEITTEMVLDIDIDEDLSTEEGKREATIDFLKQAVKEKCIDQTPLKNLLERVVDVEKVYASPMQVGIVTVTWPEFRPVQLTKDEIPQDRFIDYLLASSACFPGMKPWKIDGKEYIDGGYYDAAPVGLAIDMGATEGVLISLHGFGHTRPFDHETCQVLTVEPDEKLGSTLLFDPQTSRRNIERGYQDTLARFGLKKELK